MSLRDDMPTTAAFIDAMREAFGADAVDKSIRLGMRGEDGFFAQENGRTVGTPMEVQFSVELFGPDRHERTEAGRHEAKLRELQPPKPGKGKRKWRQ